MNKNTPIVSVIVPVYNTEKYLDKCLSSLAGQTLREIEIIIVNDGSPDNSQEIIGRFAAKYPDKVVALYQENKGPGPARNHGIEHAKGEYIGFVDSDDWVELNMFELMYETAKEGGADVVICDNFRVREDSGECRAEGIWSRYCNVRESISEFVLHSTNPALSCNKIYKRKLFQKTKYPGGYYEDLATIPVILSNCGKIAVVDKPLYYYYKREGSITSQRNDPRNLDVIKAWQRCLNECNPKYREEMAYAVYFSICFLLDFRREHLTEFVMFFIENNGCFKGNNYIGEAVRGKGLADLFTMFGKYIK